MELYKKHALSLRLNAFPVNQAIPALSCSILEGIQKELLACMPAQPAAVNALESTCFWVAFCFWLDTALPLADSTKMVFTSIRELL